MPDTSPSPTSPISRPMWWYIATWFGCGTSPIIGGTIGSLGALPFAYIIHVTLGNVGVFLAAIAMFFAGWWASNQFLAHSPEKGADPREIVVDEVAAQWLILSMLFPTLHSYFVGFVLFRFFDIVKPWPVSWADKNVKGGLGVMLDDIFAALYPMGVYLVLMIMAQLLHAWDVLLPITNFLGGSYVQR